MRSELWMDQQRQIEQMRKRSIFLENTGNKKQNQQDTKELPQNGGSFFVRSLAAMLIFTGFVQLHLGDSAILGIKSQKAIEVIAQDVDLQKVADSVKIGKNF